MRRPLLLSVLVAVMLLGCLAACSSGGRGPVRLDAVPGVPAPGDGVALRQLVVATGADDPGLAAWRSILDRAGSPYDVLLAGKEGIDRQRLVRPDGIGRYNAVLLASSALYVPAGGTDFRSALSPESWTALWDYERTFAVRQVAIGASPGTSPEDYCLRPRSEGSIGPKAQTAALTPAGAAIFDRLRPDAPIPISDAYVYRTTLEPGCAGQPVLMLGPDVVGAVSTAADGRERLALTMSVPVGRTGADLLGYGLLRWATKGVLLGEERAWFAVDVDDWLLPTQRVHVDGSKDRFRLTGPEAQSVADQQDALHERHPLASDFTLTLAYNGSTLNRNAPVQCDDSGTPDGLSSYTRCLARRFRWVNHTLSHPTFDTASYDEIRGQIAGNIEAAADAGLTVPADILKTPEYSGLGHFADKPGDPATDHGLAAANPALLRAAADLGVRYLHGNMSFPSNRPACFNCTTALPRTRGLVLVPDWPTGISFGSTTPAEAAAAYNAVYGARGTSPAAPGRDLDYPAMLAAEADIAFGHITSGSAFVHTLHQGNLHVYAPGRTLVFDWIDAVLTRYETYYAAPLENPDWPALVAYADARTSHFAGLAAGDDAVWNRTTQVLTVDPRVDGTLFVTGLAADGGDSPDAAGDTAERYGNDTVSRVRLTAGQRVAYATAARP